MPPKLRITVSIARSAGAPPRLGDVRGDDHRLRRVGLVDQVDACRRSMPATVPIDLAGGVPVRPAAERRLERRRQRGHRHVAGDDQRAGCRDGTRSRCQRDQVVARQRLPRSLVARSGERVAVRVAVAVEQPRQHPQRRADRLRLLLPDLRQRRASARARPGPAGTPGCARRRPSDRSDGTRLAGQRVAGARTTGPASCPWRAARRARRVRRRCGRCRASSCRRRAGRA